MYRIITCVEDRRGRVIALALTLSVLFLNGLWNYGFFGLESTLLGFAGILVFLIPLTALIVALRRYEGFSAGLVAAYYVWALYELA